MGLAGARPSDPFETVPIGHALLNSMAVTHAGARFSLGLCMEKVGDRARAAQCYRNALAADPGYGPAHHNLAILLEMGGNQTEAITHYEAALKAMPQDAGVRTNLANCCGRLAQSLLGQGRSNEARQALERCRQLGGSPPATLDRSVKDPSH